MVDLLVQGLREIFFEFVTQLEWEIFPADEAKSLSLWSEVFDRPLRVSQT